MGSYTPSFKTIKKDTIKAAKELFYGKDVIEKLENANDEAELSLIMREARTNL